MTVDAYFKEYKQLTKKSLAFGTVMRIATVPDKGTLAYIQTPEGKRYKFWVDKFGSPAKTGSRLRVIARSGLDLPLIIRIGSLFPVRIGTEVLFGLPKKKSTVPSVYPVICHQDYLHAAEHAIPAVPIPARKRDHRWIDDTPHKVP